MVGGFDIVNKKIYTVLMRKWYISLLILIGVILYGNNIFNEFIGDDIQQIVNNAKVHSLSNFFLFFVSSPFGGVENIAGLYYRPIMSILFSIVYTFAGANAGAFHAVQVGIHIANAVLIYLLLKRLLKQEVIAFVISLMFLIHPVNTEAVSYIANYQEVLMLFFGLLSLHTSKPIWSAVFILASLLSKETGLTFVVVGLLYYWFFKKSHFQQFVVYVLGVIFIYCILRFGIAHIFFGKYEDSLIASMPLSVRLINIPAIVYYYLQMLIWPVNLAINQQWVIRSVSWEHVIFPLVILLTISAFFIAGGIWLYRQRSKHTTLYLLFVLWFLVGLSFHIQLFPLDGTVSLRWFYVPFIGLLGLLGCLIVSLQKNTQKIMVTILIISICVLSLRTFIRTFDWRNELTLSKQDVELSHGAFYAESSYGAILLSAGQVDEAGKHLQRSVKLEPSWWPNYNTLGAYYAFKNDIPHAEAAIRKAIANGRYMPAYENLCLILIREARYQELISVLEKAFPNELPKDQTVLVSLAQSYFMIGKKDLALSTAYFLLKNAPTQRNQDFYQRIQLNQTPVY